MTAAPVCGRKPNPMAGVWSACDKPAVCTIHVVRWYPGKPGVEWHLPVCEADKALLLRVLQREATKLGDGEHLEFEVLDDFITTSSDN